VDEFSFTGANYRSTGKRPDCIFDGNQSLNRQPTVATTLQATYVALAGSKHARQLLLRDTGDAP